MRLPITQLTLNMQSLIDLAGSEKATSDKERTREGKYINTRSVDIYYSAVIVLFNLVFILKLQFTHPRVGHLHSGGEFCKEQDVSALDTIDDDCPTDELRVQRSCPLPQL